MDRNLGLLQQSPDISTVFDSSGNSLVKGALGTVGELWVLLQPRLHDGQNPNLKGVGKNLTGGVLETKGA